MAKKIRATMEAKAKGGVPKPPDIIIDQVATESIAFG